MARKVYSDEFKRSAVEQVIGQRHSVRSVVDRLGVGYDTLRKWVDTARYNSDRSLVPCDLPAAHGAGHFKKSGGLIRERAAVKFAYIRDHRDRFEVGAMCAVFGVTAAGFYGFLRRPESARAARSRDLAEQISAVHHETKGSTAASRSRTRCINGSGRSAARPSPSS